jgi:hypothetical protein
MEDYLTINENEILFVGKWMKLEIIMLSKISQTERQILHVLSYM